MTLEIFYLKFLNNSNYSSLEDTRQTNKIPCIEYLDTEESYYKMIGTYKDLKSKQKYKKYTHCEIHPSLMLGLLSSLIPFSNHNQSQEIHISLLRVSRQWEYI